MVLNLKRTEKIYTTQTCQYLSQNNIHCQACFQVFSGVRCLNLCNNYFLNFMYQSFLEITGR